ncbi:MAG: hypothetical protein LBG14_07490 [Treponema sp.]|nr:hypothetical protein [Treponema sp.]
MMLKELSALFDAVSDPGAQKSDYLKAIIEDNCLGKASGISRKKSASHLVNMYALDSDTLLFRALRWLWAQDKSAQPLLALLCLYSRDRLIQGVAGAILEKSEGSPLTVEYVSELLDELRPDTFSKATLRSSAQNILSSFAQVGYLKGKLNKTRSKAAPTAGSAAYALFLGYLSGFRGENLLTCEFAKLLDCELERVVDLAESASRFGWLSFKHIEDIYEITFPNKNLGAFHGALQ